VCGIAGFLARREIDALPLVAAMTDCLAHRGPDDQAVASMSGLTLGHRRLSILDPSPAGRQPMSTPDGCLSIVHNGEIYNFLELAAELKAAGHTLRTSTDTEVILEAYREWGPECVRRFNGMWALALWDADERTLFLSRDRLGVKPLYYTDTPAGFAFASEIKALLSLPAADPALDTSVLRDFLLDGLVDHTDRTFFRYIRVVPPGQSLLVTADGLKAQRYWRPPELADDASSRSDLADAARIEEIRALLIDSVALRLRSDVPIGSCLSGGIDSSAIVTIAAGLRAGTLGAGPLTRREREQSPQLAFHAEFAEGRIHERRFVDQVVAATGTDVKVVAPSVEAFRAELERIVWHQDQPFGSSSIVAQYFVMKRAHDASVKVLLDGQGADELFAGYPGYLGLRLASGLVSGDLEAAARMLRLGPRDAGRAVRYAFLRSTRRPTRLPIRKPLRAFLTQEVASADALHPEPDGLGGTLLARLLWDQVRSTSLPALLRYEDRNSMAFGIEARVPFLDFRLVEAALRLPDRLRIGPEGRKIALLRAMEGIVPPAIIGRRDKVAFETPQQRWLTESLPILTGILGPSVAEGDGIFRPRAGRRLMEAFASGRLAHGPFWRALSVELWLRRVVHGMRFDLGSTDRVSVA